jgi:hypothetical protein
MGLRDLFKFGRDTTPQQQEAAPPPPPPAMTSRQANEMLVAAVEANDIKKAEIALNATGSANLTCKYKYFYMAHYDSGPRRIDQVNEVPLIWFATLKDNVPMVQLLLKHGADVDAKYQGTGPLMHAVAEGATPMVRALLDGGAMMRDSNSYSSYNNAFEIARQKQYADIIQMLNAEPERRKQAQIEAARVAQEAKAAAEAAAREAEEQARWRAQNPTEPVTDNAVVVMKPLTLKK